MNLDIRRRGVKPVLALASLVCFGTMTAWAGPGSRGSGAQAAGIGGSGAHGIGGSGAQASACANLDAEDCALRALSN